MKRVSIERKKNLLPADFARDHLQDGGRPVIVTDATEMWPARSKWTFEYFGTAYGSDFVNVTLEWSSDVAKMTKLATFIDHLDKPIGDLPGFWIDSSGGRPLRTVPDKLVSSPDLPGWHASWKAFQKHPELYDDIKPIPYFVADWVSALNPTLRDIFEWTYERDYTAVYIGPEGVLSPLHVDYGHTHAYLAQIRGRKKAILFSPKDTELLYSGRVDPEQPDLERFELLDKATMYECVIEPGEVLFMPSRWWHWVRSLDKSITVSHNFFNGVNFNEHIASLLRKLPRLVRGFGEFPGWREELRVAWRSKGFTDPEA